MGKKILIILIWFLSLVIISIYTYENPNKIGVIKNYLSKTKKQEIKFYIKNYMMLLKPLFLQCQEIPL